MMIDKQGCLLMVAGAVLFFLALYGALGLFGEPVQ